MQGLDRVSWSRAVERLRGWAAIELTPADMAIARVMSGLFWLMGGAVTAVLLPLEPPTDAIGDAGWALAVVGVIACFVVGVRHFDPAVSIRRIYVAGFVATGMIAALEWLAGGRETSYHYLYMLPVLFAAAAQSPRRVTIFAATVAVVIWVPLLYEGTERAVIVDIATQLVTLFSLGAAVWALFVVLRMQRRTIAEQRSRAELLAREDALTGLGNRRAFTEAVAREVSRAEREDGDLSLLVADLDRFKSINDDRGHAVGDEALRRAAEALRQVARQADACFRWGGDEFAVLLPGADRDQAEAVAGRLREAVDAAGPSSAPRLSITCGVAELVSGCDPEALIAAADRNLIARKPTTEASADARGASR